MWTRILAFLRFVPAVVGFINLLKGGLVARATRTEKAEAELAKEREEHSRLRVKHAELLAAMRSNPEWLADFIKRSDAIAAGRAGADRGAAGGVAGG